MTGKDIVFRPVPVDVPVARFEAGQLLERFPYRAPAVVAQALRPFAEDRIVCDLGCGGGDLIWLISRYAKQGIGIEIDQTRARLAARRAESSDCLQFLQIDYWAESIPRADVYYAWPNDPDTFRAIAERLHAHCSPCLLAAGAAQSFFESERDPAVESTENRLADGRRSHVLSLVDQYGGEVNTFPYEEDSARPEWSGTGTWALALITL